jgi:hypothetical protein
MIVNNSRSFIFIHVPKAAGTSVTHALKGMTTFRDVEVGGTKDGAYVQDAYGARFDLRKHSTGAEIRAKAGPAVWWSFFTFAFVRDPYARAYSVWKFLCNWRSGPDHRFAADRSFGDFVSTEEFGGPALDISRPQADWLTQDGEIIKGLDFIGRVESFDRDFSFVLSTIRRRPTDYETRRAENVSAAPDEWRSAMTPAIRSRIETVYSRDFELFGY